MNWRPPVIAVFLSFAASLPAFEPAFPGDVQQQKFIDKLTAGGDYYRAITETYRLFCFSGALPGNLPLDFHLARLYMLGRNYPLARNAWFSCLTNKGLGPQDRLELRMGLARSYELEGDWNNAMIQYSQCPPPPSDSGAFIKRVEMSIRLFKLDEAGTLIAEAKDHGWAGGDTDRLRMLENRYAQASHLPYRSEVAADFLSVIPGLNLLYLGRIGDGLIRLTVQAGTGALAWYSFSRGDDATGILFSVALLSWIVYNFSMNSDAVADYNRALEKKFQDSF